MELIKKSFSTRVKNLVVKIGEDNLFLLSSSMSYYSALAIAPFMLILLSVASFIGGDIQKRMILMAQDFSPEVGQMIQIVFDNVNEGVNFGSVSGIIGVAILLWTSSLVFLQMRYSLDVIYGHFNPKASKTIFELVIERLFSMFFVILTGIFFIASAFLTGMIDYFFRAGEALYLTSRLGGLFINLLIYVFTFWGIHFFTPTRRPKLKMAFKMGLLSAIFFIIGNVLVTTYLKGIAANSIYGAAGSVLVFLTWTYYTSFTMFLSVELFLYMKRIGKIK